MNSLFTTQKISPVGQVNKQDLQKIVHDTLVFFSAPILMYLLQVQGTLAHNGILIFKDLAPSATTLGTIYGWGLSILINIFLKLKNGDT